MIRNIATTMCIIITMLLVYIVCESYESKRNDILLSTSLIFREAIDMNEKVAMKGIPFYSNYDPQKSPNDISGKEKLDWSIQFYITQCDVNRLSLDSVFHSKLVSHNLSIPSAVSVSFEGKTHYSLKDTSFYSSAIILTPVIYRRNYIPNDQIVLRGYVKLPYFCVLKQIKFLPLVIILWLLVIIAIIIGYYLWQKRAIKTKEKILIENHIPLKTEIIEWSDLSDEIFFDRKNGIIKCRDKSIILRNNSLKLFNLLVDKLDKTVSYNEFCTKVLMRKIDEPSKSDKDTVQVAIKRLKDNLQEISEIQIEAVKGNGYRLKIVN